MSERTTDREAASSMENSHFYALGAALSVRKAAVEELVYDKFLDVDVLQYIEFLILQQHHSADGGVVALVA